ncbi:ribonuclease inhibitor-like [Cetorhinus maximus]
MVLRDPDCKVIELELARNGLTWACAADLISALVSNPSINGLSLNKNDLGDVGVQQLAEGLQHPDCNVEIIQLDSNCLTEASAQGLSNLLRVHPELQWLILDKNQLGDQGLMKLAEGIRTCRLRRLGLGFNGLTDVAAEELISALCVNRTIQFLYLTGNHFTEGSVPSFVTLIQTCLRLRKLWLGRNPLSAESKQALLSEQASRADLKVML